MRLLLPLLVFFGCSGTAQLDPNQGNWPAPSIADFVHQPRYAVTNNRSDSLSFVNIGPAAPQLLGTFSVGDIPVELEGPHHLQVSPDGKYIYYNLSNYVPGSGTGPHGSHGLGTIPGSLVKLDARTGVAVGEVLVDRSPGDVVLSHDGSLAYVSHYDLLRVQSYLQSGGAPETAYSAVAIVDTKTMQRLSLTPVCPTVHGEGLSADGKTLFVTCALSDQLAVLDVSDPEHPQVTRKLAVGPDPGSLALPAYSPYALAVSPKDGTVWISNNQSGDVRVFDPVMQQMDIQRTVITTGITMFGEFSHDGETFYVAHQGNGDQLSMIRTADLHQTKLSFTASDCVNMHVVKLAPDEQSATVICEGDHAQVPGTAVTVTLNPLAIVGHVGLGLFPDGIAYCAGLPTEN